MPNPQSQPQSPVVAVIIPTFNNGAAAAQVAAAAREYISSIIIVNDGSTDDTGAHLAADPLLDIVTLATNSGKGAALRTGFSRASQRGFTHAITMDADWQHLPSDLPLFLDAIASEPDALWIGNRTLPVDSVAQPPRSRIGARIGTFWYRFHTGLRIDDTQCGFRAYPLALVDTLKRTSEKYEYELDMLIQAAWRKNPVRQIPIHLRYLPPEQRVSHFRPLRDFLRLSSVNSRAALTRIFCPWRFIDAPGGTVREKLTNLVREELRVHHDPVRASVALALGVCVGLLPIHGFQVITIIALAFLFRLNKTLSFTGVTISSPPFLPFWIMTEYGLGRLLFPLPALRSAKLFLDSIGLGFVSVALTRATAAITRVLDMSGMGAAASWLGQHSNATRAAIAMVQWFLGSIVFALAAGALVFALCLPILRRINTLRSAARTEQKV